jgi:hypothetical protein
MRTELQQVRVVSLAGVRAARRFRVVRVAALDLGSNSFHLVVVDARDGTLRPLVREKESLRLGELVARGGKVGADGAQRCLTRFHLRGTPKPDFEPFRALDAKRRARVVMLTASGKEAAFGSWSPPTTTSRSSYGASSASASCSSASSTSGSTSPWPLPWSGLASSP